MMSVYEVLPNGSLVEKGCSENNSFVASYSTELVVGQTYKIRLKLNETITTNKNFHICITTPNNLCELDAFNFNFEKFLINAHHRMPDMQMVVSGALTQFYKKRVPPNVSLKKSLTEVIDYISAL